MECTLRSPTRYAAAGCISLLSLFLFISHNACGFQASASTAGIEFFEKQIRPVLVEHCLECHSGTKRSGGLSLDNRDAILQGGDSGAAADLVSPQASLLLKAVRYQNADLQMPPKGPLPHELIAILEKWIEMGLPDPRVAPDDSTGSANTGMAPTGMSLDDGRNFWSMQPISDPMPPRSSSPDHDSWGRTPLDRFVMSSLSQHAMTPANPSSRREWIRRVYLDLTGIPPSAEEIERFEQDDAPDSYEVVVDSLLNSPQYGVRWGRHWLDVVRYADSNGLDENLAFGTAWKYRDYVIRSWNQDKRFNRFVQEQIAGDLLPDSSTESHMGTGFLVLGAKVLAEPDREKLAMDTIDEQVDTLGKAFLGMTFGCVRCHDHKFDPVYQSDYYALAAILNGTKTFGETNTGAIKHWREISIASEEERAAIKKVDAELAAKQATLNKAKSEALDQLRKRVRSQVVDYLEAAMSLAPDCTLVECEKAAGNKSLHPRVLQTCRVYLARFSETPLFAPWHQYLSNHDTTGMRSFYESVFETDGSETDLKKQAKAALQDPTGLLAIPAKLEHALLPEEIDKIHRLADEARIFESNAPDESTFMGVVDGKVAESMPIHIRGNHRMPGQLVSRGFPVVMVSQRDRTIFERHQSGRLELAYWLTNPSHPLTARVFVNRLWRWHFGKGIVETTENFGRLGAAPSHPELLDHLAYDFIASGWSIKQLQRTIVLSETYRMSTSHAEAVGYEARDPENKWLWRFPIQRLDAEQVRDSILHVTGLLDNQLGGKSVPLRNRQFVFDHTSIDHTKYDSNRRTAYFPIIRNNLAPLLQQFDFPDPTMPTGNRATTTVAPQSLLLLNSEWILDASHHLSCRAIQHASTETDRIQWLYRSILGRNASAKELDLASSFAFPQKVPAHDRSIAETESAIHEIRTRLALVAQNLMIGSEFFYVK